LPGDVLSTQRLEFRGRTAKLFGRWIQRSESIRILCGLETMGKFWEFVIGHGVCAGKRIGGEINSSCVSAGAPALTLGASPCESRLRHANHVCAMRTTFRHASHVAPCESRLRHASHVCAMRVTLGHASHVTASALPSIGRRLALARSCVHSLRRRQSIRLESRWRLRDCRPPGSAIPR
jgi:hypothetical protein